MAVGAVVNAAWDLKARLAGKPLWKLLADLSPEQLVDLVDFRYLERRAHAGRGARVATGGRAGTGRRARRRLLAEGYPAYTTTPGWLGYDDEKLVRLCREAVADGFAQIKLKVGADRAEDQRRLALVREAVGPDMRIAIDANQSWSVNEAIELGAVAARARPVLDRGADVAGRRSRTRGDSPGRDAGAGRHRASTSTTAWSSSSCCRPRRSTSCRSTPAAWRRQREPRDPAAGGEVRRAGLPACRRRRLVRDGPAPGDVRLRRCQRHVGAPRRSSTSTICTSTSRNPVVIRSGRYQTPTAPGAGARMHAGSVDAFSLPRWSPVARSRRRARRIEMPPRREFRMVSTPIAFRAGLADRRLRAATYVGDQTFRIEDREARAPAAGEVQFDVAYVGICGTDLHIMHGAMDARVTMPAVIGHEMSGDGRRPSATASTGWALGDRVTVMPLDWCGQCPACQAGHGHICQNLVFVGIDAAGAMQQSWTVPERLLVRLAAGSAARPRRAHRARRSGSARRSPRCATPRRARARGRRRADRAAHRARRGRATGADVLVLEPNAFRRAVAEGLGLSDLRPGGRRRRSRPSTSWTGGAGADVAFEVSGSGRGTRRGRPTHVRGARHGSSSSPSTASPVPVDLFRVFWRELDAVRRARLRAGRLRAGGRAADGRSDPRRAAHLRRRAARAHAGRVRGARRRRRGHEGAHRLPP